MLCKLALITIALAILLWPNLSLARARGQGWCEQGNQTLTITGAGTGAEKIQRSHPSCTVTVYATGTSNLSTIFSDNSATPLANPFTAQASGIWFFYADNGRYDVQLSGAGIGTPFTLADIFLIDTVSLAATNAKWSDLTNPTANLAITQGTNTTTFTWGVLAGTTDAFTLVDGASTSTGNLLEVRTGAGSTLRPFRVTAVGTANGIEVDNAGLLSAVGTGGIAATTLACTSCISDAEVDATGITTRSKLPSALAYEDEANSFTVDQTFQQQIHLRGGTGFDMVLDSTPSATRTATFPDATFTVVGHNTTQTLSGKTFSDNLVWQSGTGFTGTFDHANSANRVYTLPDSSVTLLAAPALTAGSVMFTDGTTLVQDNSNLFFNNTTNRLGVGTASPSTTLHVAATAVASEVAVRVQGNATANTNVLEVYNSAASPALQSRFDSTGAFVTALQITSSLVTGTAPFSVASTTVVTNLNADKLDGADWAAPAAIGSTTPAAGTFTSISGDGVDIADAGEIKLANADIIGWEASPTGTDPTITMNSSENFVIAGGVNGLQLKTGAVITGILSATASLDFTALAANSCETLTITVTGAVDGNTVFLGVPDALADVDGATERTAFFGWVSATNVVSVRRCNVTAGSTAEPAAATVRATVVQI